MRETPPPFQSVAVLGAGSFGTSLALVLAGNRLPVTLWGHNAGAMERMAAARENTRLPAGRGAAGGAALDQRRWPTCRARTSS